MLKYFKYQLPFKKPFIIADQEIRQREGIILVYQSDDITAYGEAAPLPGFSDETLQQVEAVLKLNKKALQEALQADTAPELLYSLDQIHHFPSLSFAIDTLIHDFSAKKKKQSLGLYLSEQKPTSVKVNGVISILSESETLQQVRHLVSAQFEVLKVKVGREFETEKKILEKIHAEFPSIRLRIDANQSWTADEAIRNLERIEHLPIEYCEQPVHRKAGNEFAKIRKSTSIPIAADESVRNKKDAFELIKSGSVDVLILKPSLMGRMENIFVTKALAESHNIGITISTAMESAVARSCIAYLAAGIGNNRYHGLATGNLFTYDIAGSEWLNKSEIHFPDAAGLGISPDILRLKEF